jgi:hypothetical protein
MTRLALLLSLLALGALGLVACDDDETATAETETITSGRWSKATFPVAWRSAY